MKRPWAVGLAGLLLLILLAWTFRYEYLSIHFEENATWPVRVNRFTGTTQILIPFQKWETLHPLPAERPITRDTGRRDPDDNQFAPLPRVLSLDSLLQTTSPPRRTP